MYIADFMEKYRGFKNNWPYEKYPTEGINKILSYNGAYSKRIYWPSTI